MYDDLYDDFFKITKSFFSNIDCGLCRNYGLSDREFGACDYCSNHNQHNLLWNPNDAILHNFTKELIKIVREHENDN